MSIINDCLHRVSLNLELCEVVYVSILGHSRVSGVGCVDILNLDEYLTHKVVVERGYGQWIPVQVLD